MRICCRGGRPSASCELKLDLKESEDTIAYQLQLLLHLPCYVHALLAHLLDRIELTLIQSNRREDCRVAKVCIRIGAETNLAGAD